ncbi:MAG: hypothetical protein [Bacteroides phage LoVEphage]|nr:MAG: hypothetical protein [Bacteroides phage LoVEphage]
MSQSWLFLIYRLQRPSPLVAGFIFFSKALLISGSISAHRADLSPVR